MCSLYQKNCEGSEELSGLPLETPLSAPVELPKHYIRWVRAVRCATYPGQNLTEQELKVAQDNDPELTFFKDLFQKTDSRPAWSTVALQTESVKCLWSQWDRLSLIRGLLFRRSKNTTHVQKPDQ